MFWRITCCCAAGIPVNTSGSHFTSRTSSPRHARYGMLDSCGSGCVSATAGAAKNADATSANSAASPNRRRLATSIWGPPWKHDPVCLQRIVNPCSLNHKSLRRRGPPTRSAEMALPPGATTRELASAAGRGFTGETGRVFPREERERPAGAGLSARRLSFPLGDERSRQAQPLRTRGANGARDQLVRVDAPPTGDGLRATGNPQAKCCLLPGGTVDPHLYARLGLAQPLHE